MLIQQGLKTRKLYRARTHIVALALLLTLSCLVIIKTANAQSQQVLTLEQHTKSLSIAPYSYITLDDEKILSPDTIVARHRNNLRGERKNTDTINLGINAVPSWILFTVYNKSNIDDWILHFGNTLDGRIGMVKKINIMDYTTKQTVMYPAHKDSKAPSPFLGNILPLKIKPGTQVTYILYIESDNGLPLVLAPKIMPQNIYMRDMLSVDAKTIITSILFIGLITFFIISYYIGRNAASIALASYYTLLYTLFLNLDIHFLSHGLISGATLFTLYIASFIPLFLAIKFFNKITYDQRPMENMALIALGIFIVAISLLYLVIIGMSNTGLIALTGTICISFVSLITITALTGTKTPIITTLFCVGLSFVPLSFLVLSLAIINIIPTSSFTINLFWFLQIPGAACFIASYIKSNKHRHIRKEQEHLHQKHEQQSLAQLQKSKDSADQARLLRVIERERELMAELREREVKRTEEMRQSKDIADKANHAKSAFLAVVSHEIRTPMNGILGMVQLLQNTSLTKSQNEYVDIMQKSGDTMMALLNDILDFEKIERGNMELENIDFNLHQLAKDIIILMSGHAAQKNIEIKTDIADNVPVTVTGDPTRLRQVLLNLANNGMKFTQEGHVTIEITMPETAEDSIIHFAIKDTGIGISEDAQSKLFTPFKQAETSTSRRYGGTGLGLAISSRLIEAMKGKITVSSEVGVGSTFSFSIKLEAKDVRDDGAAQNTSEENVKQARPLNILIVEDNEMNRKVLEGFLSCDGHTLSMAQNGMEALDICRTTKLDLILMDIQMDGLSGLETTTKIRANSNKEIASTPIIALTGNVMLEDIETFFAAHMNGFIAKPIDARKLRDVIYNASVGKFENDLPKDFFDTNEGHNPMDIENIDHNLSFDNREDFTEETRQTPMTKESDPILHQKVNLTLDSDDSAETNGNDSAATPVPKDITPEAPLPKFKPTDKSDDELTEIQKYLMEQHSENTEASDEPEMQSQAPVAEAPAVEAPAIETTKPVIETKEDIVVIAPAAETQEDVASVIVATNTEEETVPTEMANTNTTGLDADDIEDILDTAMLQSLIDTLGEEQFANLLDGFLEKAAEIIENIDKIITEGNIPSLGARAHELKGMSGNFGMKQISAIAGEIEKTAKMAQKENSISEAKKLNAANEQTKAAFQKWRENFKA